MSDSGTPGWLMGLIIVFAVATAATFGLAIYRHAEDSALLEQYHQAALERQRLDPWVRDLQTRIAPLEDQIRTRRTHLEALVGKKTEQETVVGEVEQAITDTTRLVSDAAVHAQALATQLEENLRKYKQLTEDARARRLELHQEEDRALALERKHDEDRLAARLQIEALSRELEQLNRQARKANTVADARISELDDRITQLTQQRELNNRELRSDGRVLASRATDGYVVIDLGHGDALRNGTRFVVFNRRGGRTIVKGSVEVVSVEARLSTARVLEETDQNDPIVPGDQLHNPVYNPEAVKIYVIKGDFRRYSADELARFITDAGGKVERELSTATDYLVAGDRAQVALDQASKLGISVLSEKQLVELVRYEPRLAVRAGMVFALAGRFTAVSTGRIESFIEKSGGRVVGSVKDGVDTLIAGEGADEAIARARTLGIPVLDHAQFAHLNEQR